MLGTTGGPQDHNAARLKPGNARNVRDRRTRDRDHAPRMARHSCAARQRYRHAAPATPVFTSSDSRESCFSHEFLEYETAVIATQSPSAKSITPACVVIDARDVPDQRLHDASRFPLVRLRHRAVQPGYAFAWGAEMQRLLSLKTPFVIVSEHKAHETAGDTRMRNAWLLSQRATLALFCRGFIPIQPRTQARATPPAAVRTVTPGSGG